LFCVKYFDGKKDINTPFIMINIEKNKYIFDITLIKKKKYI